MERKIGFIGAGNIGSAMVGSIIKSGFASASSIYAADTGREKLEQLQKATGINICKDNIELVDMTDVVVMAVKPQIIKSVIEEIREHFGDRMLITIAAGIPIKVFEDILGNDKRIFRAMPNLPLLVGEGMTIISYRSKADSEDLEYSKSLFKNFGRVEELDESLLGNVISLTASSPAYVFMLIESMVVSTVRAGVPVNLATRIVAQTVLGSAKMFLEGKADLDLLKDECSREFEFIGIEAGLFNEDRIRTAVAEAMKECNRKAMEFEKL